MKTKLIPICITLLLFSCGEKSNRVELGNEGPNIASLLEGATPEFGQQVISEELEVSTLSQYERLNVECDFQKVRTTQTVVKIEEDDIYILQEKSFTDLSETSDAICKEQFKIEQTLVKKNLKKEKESLSNTSGEINDNCQRDCNESYNVEDGSFVYNYSGIFKKQGIEANVNGKLIPNEISPWLSPYIYREENVTFSHGNDTIINREQYTRSLDRAFDISHIDFENYELEIYEDISKDVTDAFFQKHNDAIYQDQEQKSSIVFVKANNKMIHTSQSTKVQDTKCDLRREYTIGRIEESSSISRRMRLPQTTLTLYITNEHISFKPAQKKNKALCDSIKLPDLENRTIHKYIQIKENGNLEYEISRNKLGKIYSKQ